MDSRDREFIWLYYGETQIIGNFGAKNCEYFYHSEVMNIISLISKLASEALDIRLPRISKVGTAKVDAFDVEIKVDMKMPLGQSWSYINASLPKILAGLCD